MKEYVICYAHQLPLYQMQNIVCIERKKDDWQRGLVNLPGGRMEPGEMPEQAAFRELKEETTLHASLPDIRVLGVIQGEEWRVHVCYCPYRDWHDGGPQQAKSNCGEEGKIITLKLREIATLPNVIPNLRLIVPLCIAGVSGWVLREGETKFDLNLTLPSLSA
jgi:8-oxo-dGTP pyrophosphatase MutT (NUDIX family)